MPRRALDRVRELYRQIPALECKGLCANSCVPVSMSRAEAARAHPGEPERTSTLARGPLGVPRCTHLTSDNSCGIYADRPMICRLWGATDSMPCPHGCVPAAGHLPGVEAVELMLDSLIAGGHELVDNEEMAAIMRTAIRDPELSAALLRVIRGEQDAVVLLAKHVSRFRRQYRETRRADAVAAAGRALEAGDDVGDVHRR